MAMGSRGAAFQVAVLAFVAALAVVAWISLHRLGAHAQGSDTVPPTITNIRIIDAGSTSTIVRWKTDERASSYVQFGITKDVGIARESAPLLTDHEVTITDLEPLTRYYFRVHSADAAGNQSFSGGYQFTTKGTKPLPNIETVRSPEEQLDTQKIAQLLDRLQSLEALQLVAEKLQEVGEAELEPPRILGDPDIEVGAEEATILWETDRAADGTVQFASEAEYRASGRYGREEGVPGAFSLLHRVTLHGLRPETTYHYKIVSRPQVGPMGESDDRTFTTKSVLPQIFGLRLQKIEETAATVTWSTQVAAAGLVEYTNLNTRETKSVGNPSLQLTHTIRLADLKFKSPYQIVVKARTSSGEEISSDPLTFVTKKDVDPPVIGQVNNESTLYPGAEAKVQTIVTWDTDEPSICQFFYGEGLAVAAEEALSFPEETGAVLKHVQVITEFTPSTVYKFWVSCRDHNDNTSRSEDFVLFTPEKEKSIIDIIIENFQGTFGWVKNIGK